MNRIRVLLADDQALVRAGFATMLSVEDDIEVVGQVANGREAVDFAAEHTVDVILMDVQMPVLDGIRATELIAKAGSGKVIILTTFERDDYLFDAIRSGASGFLLKNADPEDLISAVHAVAGGYALLAPEVTVRVIERFARHLGEGGAAGDGAADDGAAPAEGAVPAGSSSSHVATATPAASAGSAGTAETADQRRRRQLLESLTHREREVLTCMAAGLSNAELAGRLYLAEATVKSHVSSVLSKIQVRDRVQAVVFAYECGLIRPGE